MESKINIILGTMNFGPQVNTGDSLLMVEELLRQGFNELDTAFVYNEGSTEKIIGEILQNLANKNLSIATKVHPRITGKLDKEAIQLQFQESLSRMGLDKVDILYFHFPDKITPIEEALDYTNELFKLGKIKKLGISNFPAWKVIDIWHLCDKNNWIKPTIYQGMYNGVCRNVEKELFPAIRQLGIRFYAFNPLAGGLLTGKHKKYDDEPLPGRFSRLKSYRNRYWKKSYFEAIELLILQCKAENIMPVEAAYRWLVYHSQLDRDYGDGIIIGASSLSQLNQNLISCNLGPLPERIVETFNAAWEASKPESPEYFNFFPK
ncbi:MAG: aldo/keto reductase family protein [Bacteroidota bacterium]